MATQGYIFAPEIGDNTASGAGGNNVGVANLLAETVILPLGGAWRMVCPWDPMAVLFRSLGLVCALPLGLHRQKARRGHGQFQRRAVRYLFRVGRDLKYLAAVDQRWGGYDCQ